MRLMVILWQFNVALLLRSAEGNSSLFCVQLIYIIFISVEVVVVLEQLWANFVMQTGGHDFYILMAIKFSVSTKP